MTFEDLQFETMGSLFRAEVIFGNGIGLSVIQRTPGIEIYEAAFIREFNGHLTGFIDIYGNGRYILKNQRPIEINKLLKDAEDFVIGEQA